MKLLISHLKREGEHWALNEQAPVALLDLEAAPTWTFYDPRYEDKLKGLFQQPVYFSVEGSLVRPEPYSEEALRHLCFHELPAIGLGAAAV